jgi:hypothetical protein
MYTWGGKLAKLLGYFCNLKELPKVNNHPRGEKSPNLVTLNAAITAHVSYLCLPMYEKPVTWFTFGVHVHKMIHILLVKTSREKSTFCSSQSY